MHTPWILFHLILIKSQCMKNIGLRAGQTLLLFVAGEHLGRHWLSRLTVFETNPSPLLTTRNRCAVGCGVSTGLGEASYVDNALVAQSMFCASKGSEAQLIDRRNLLPKGCTGEVIAQIRVK